ncbi:MAG TPA: nitroreductase/quinone reductase family protein, partial [Actinomycetota bacterium]
MLITLTTTGSRSGQPRDAQLYAFEDGDDLIVTGSRGGATTDPAWAHNLRAHPAAFVCRGRTRLAVRAHEADGRQRDRLWQLVCAGFPMYESYQR